VRFSRLEIRHVSVISELVPPARYKQVPQKIRRFLHDFSLQITMFHLFFVVASLNFRATSEAFNYLLHPGLI